MTANNKEEFFAMLETELTRIGVEDIDEIKKDFEQHFEESAEQGISEEDTALRLGNIKEIARNYLNLESERINSIIAKNVENNGKKVSLTKQGRSVPADLSLMSGRDVRNSDCVRQYTPEHISEEIYPDRESSSEKKVQTAADNNVNFSGANSAENADNTPKEDKNSGNTANDNVADAFSNAGKAVAAAAKAAGAAIADAFNKTNIKDTVKKAGHNVKFTPHGCGVPTPNEDFRKNVNNDRTGTIPEGAARSRNENLSGSFTFESIRGKTPNINKNKLVGIILMDIFLWSWLVPLFAGFIIFLFGGGISCIIVHGISEAFSDYKYGFIGSIFLCMGFCGLGGTIVIFSLILINPFIRLIKYIIMLHVKAVYDL